MLLQLPRIAAYGFLKQVQREDREAERRGGDVAPRRDRDRSLTDRPVQAAPDEGDREDDQRDRHEQAPGDAYRLDELNRLAASWWSFPASFEWPAGLVVMDGISFTTTYSWWGYDRAIRSRFACSFASIPASAPTASESPLPRPNPTWES